MAGELAAALAAKITGFVATMRENGFAVGVAESEDALRVAAALGVVSHGELREGWRGLLCGRADEWGRFDDLFDSYWRRPNRRKAVETRTAGGGAIVCDGAAQPAGGKAGAVVQHGADGAGGAGEGGAQAGASAAESVETSDFRGLNDPEQTRAIEVAIRRFARRVRRLRTRQEAADMAGRRLDLRRTMRRAVGAGGVPARLHFRVKRRVRPRLVLLVDVSRSMSMYSFFYLRVARALAAELTDVHVFSYHTQLTHVSDALNDPDPWRAQERLAMLSAGWAGGTRIGDCLAAFNRRYAARLVHARTAVIIASDGYDTGEPGLVGREVRALAGRARRLVWINPLKAVEGYTPAARGMSEALPYLDVFAAGHDLASVAAALGGLVAAL